MYHDPRSYNKLMSTLADPAVKASVRERIERLTPNAQRQWGRMAPHQMICHLSDGYRMSNGERNPRPIDNFFTRSVVRWVAMHTSIPWPKGIKTVAEADQEQGGTKPAEWDRDRAALAQLVDSFQAKDGHHHPIFGPLTAAEWNVWGFRHADHHLRQFGV
jgi:hypothetical protein